MLYKNSKSSFLPTDSLSILQRTKTIKISILTTLKELIILKFKNQRISQYLTSQILNAFVFERFSESMSYYEVMYIIQILCHKFQSFLEL